MLDLCFVVTFIVFAIILQRVDIIFLCLTVVWLSVSVSLSRGNGAVDCSVVCDCCIS